MGLKFHFVTCDFETRSAQDIKAGAWLYAEHPTTDVLCFAYRLNGVTRLLTAYDIAQGDDQLIELTENPRMIFVAHNAAFEQAIWAEIMVKRYGYPPIPIERWRDTMAKCYYYAIPGSLDAACKILNLEHKKNPNGKKLIKLLSCPNKYGNFYEEWEKPEEYKELYDYCESDVLATEGLNSALPDLPSTEQRLWFVDQRINQQGLHVDLEACYKAVEFIEIEKAALLDRFHTATGTDLRPTQREKMKDWFKSRGLNVPNTRKETLNAILNNGGLDQDVADAITLMASANKASLAKYPAFIRRSRADGLLREAFAYCGAKRTHRFAGRGVQLQNLPRPKMDSDLVISCLKAMDYDTFSSVYDDVNAALSTGLRGVIVAPPGKELLVADFEQMENRVCAWLAGDENKLNRFRAGVDPYKISASAIYGIKSDEVDIDQRFVGKVAELALQYEGGIAALAKMSKGYDLNLEPLYFAIRGSASPYELSYTDFCWKMYLDSHKRSGTLEKPISKEAAVVANIIKMRWREAHPEIVDYWKELNDAACMAALSEYGEEFTAGSPEGEVTFFKHSRWLCCKLPSGICLFYLFPKVRVGSRGKMTLSYWGDKGYETTYGGKLCENITQAVQRVLLTDAIVRLEDKYPVSVHVHDEIISAVEIGQGDIEEFESMMAESRPWARGIPIGAKGDRVGRYRKIA